MTGWWILPSVLFGAAMTTAIFALAFGSDPAGVTTAIPTPVPKTPTILDILDFIAKWAVAPLIGALWYLDRKRNANDLKHMAHRAAIEVLNAGQ